MKLSKARKLFRDKPWLQRALNHHRPPLGRTKFTQFDRWIEYTVGCICFEAFSTLDLDAIPTWHDAPIDFGYKSHSRQTAFIRVSYAILYGFGDAKSLLRAVRDPIMGGPDTIRKTLEEIEDERLERRPAIPNYYTAILRAKIVAGPCIEQVAYDIFEFPEGWQLS